VRLCVVHPALAGVARTGALFLRKSSGFPFFNAKVRHFYS
jgi:hypothetical protein